MKIETRVSHNITFTVEAFEAQEGGMDHDSFGKEVQTIAEAIEILRLAKISSNSNWIIVCNVTTLVLEGK